MCSSGQTHTVMLAFSLQLILDMRAPKLALFLFAYIGASTSFYMGVVRMSAPLAMLRVSVRVCTMTV